MEEEIIIKTEEKKEESSTEQKIEESEIKKDLPKEITETKNSTVSIINMDNKDVIANAVENIKHELDTSKSLKEQAKDAVALSATITAIQDEKLVSEITDFKKEELKTGASASLKEEQVKHTTVEKQLQEAKYGVYEGIADLIGLKKPLPKGMLNSLMIILIPLLVVYYSIVGIVTGIINVTMDCVNAITERFAAFAKPAKKVIILVAFAAIVVAILLVVKFFLNKYEIIDW